MPITWRRRRATYDPHRARLGLIESMRAVMAARNRVEQERLRLMRRSLGKSAADGQVVARLYLLESLLERVYLRLNTLIVGGYIDWRSLALTVGLVRQALSRYGHLSPDITSQLAKIEGDLTQLWASVEAPAEEDVGMSSVDSEVQRIVKEAEEEALRKVGRAGPSPAEAASSS